MNSERPQEVASSDPFQALQLALRRFADERDWQQFHSPKNLSMALCGEVGELVAHFQWLTEAASRELDEETRAAVELEMADVMLYLLRLADVLNIDLISACELKMRINTNRYPVGSSKGRATKYDRL